MAAHNKGKVLRGGHYVKPPRPAHNRGKVLRNGHFVEAESINRGPYTSEITGRTYASERQMRAAEQSSIRMKEQWARQREAERIEKIDRAWREILEAAERETPKPFEQLSPMRNRISHSDPDSIMYKLFYEIQGGDWSKLYPGTLTRYCDRYGFNSDIEYFIHYILPFDNADMWSKLNVARQGG